MMRPYHTRAVPAALASRPHFYKSYHTLLHLHMTAISDRVIGRGRETRRPHNDVPQVRWYTSCCQVTERSFVVACPTL